MRLGASLEGKLPSKVFAQIAVQVPDYKDLSYVKLAQVSEQWPIVGRSDLYYGGTTYENTQGLGVQIAPAAQRGAPLPLGWPKLPEFNRPKIGLLALPVTRLFDQGGTLLPSVVLQHRIPDPHLGLNPEDAARLKISEGATVQVLIEETSVLVTAHILAEVPLGMVLTPRSFGVPVSAPTQVQVRLAEKVLA
jgi:NADH-quinone oxidoreductase subunit G